MMRMLDAECVISPRREKGEPILDGPVLLFLNPFESGLAMALAEAEKGKRYFMFNSGLVELTEAQNKKKTYLCGPAVGAPMAVLILEKLIALGVRQFLICGWCGSLNEQLKIGELLLPTWSVCEEGVSAHYPVPGKVESSPDLRQKMRAFFEGKKISVKQGPVWTTDAPYRETREKIKRYSHEGILGVEMEFSALCQVAAFRRVEMAAVLLVSDELWPPQWRPGFKTKAFKQTSSFLVRSLIEFCRQ